MSNSDLEATTIYHCVSLEDLAEELSDDFSFDQDSAIVILQICLQRKTPAVRGAALHKAGTFTLDLSAYQNSFVRKINCSPKLYQD